MHIQIILLLKSLKLFNTCTRFDILLQIASHVLAYTTACINPLYVNIQFIFFFLFSNQNLWHKHSRWKFYFFFSPFIFSACTLFCRRIFVKHSKRYGFFFFFAACGWEFLLGLWFMSIIFRTQTIDWHRIYIIIFDENKHCKLPHHVTIVDSIFICAWPSLFFTYIFSHIYISAHSKRNAEYF